MEEDPYDFITKKSFTPSQSQDPVAPDPVTSSPIAPVADVASPVDVGKCSTNMQALAIKEDPYDFITKNSLIPPHIEEKLKRTPFAREGEVFTSPSYYHPNFKWPTVAPVPAADVAESSANVQEQAPKDH